MKIVSHLDRKYKLLFPVVYFLLSVVLLLTRDASFAVITNFFVSLIWFVARLVNVGSRL